MKIPMRITLWAALLLLAAFPALAAEAGALSGGPSRDPVDVRSDSSEFKSKENLVIFTGSVVAVKGKMTINADRLEVRLNPATKELDQVTATGNVSVRREEVLATGAKAVYTVADDAVTLTGSPKIWRGADAVEGEVVVMHLNEERMEVKGSTRVILNPAKEKKEPGK